MTTVMLAILCLAVSASASEYPDLGQPLVDIDGLGKVLGIFKTSNVTQSKQNVSAFLGVPYAKAPVKDLRWRLPQPHDPWPGIRSAQDYGNKCITAGGSKLSDDQDILLPVGQSEDCLMINIFAPYAALKSSKKLPVMFWVHSGGYVAGSGNIEGENLVASANFNVVVVSINYR